MVDMDQVGDFSPQTKPFVYIPSLLIFHVSQYSLNQMNPF